MGRKPTLSCMPGRGALCAALLLLSGASALAGGAEAPGARPGVVSAVSSKVEALADRARLVFELSGAVKANARIVANPPRVIVDLPEVAFRIEPRAGRAATASKPIKSYRYGQFAPGRSRVVVDLDGPAKILRVESVPAGEAARLVLEVAPTDDEKFAAAVAESAKATLESELAAPAPVASDANADKPVVVIDPGHGGVDMGASGRHGEHEKDIVLEFAKALQAKVEAGGRLRALLTRSDDVFVPLGDRVRFARSNNAELFLSIHADTLGEPYVEGATVYTVSSKASDAEAARIAEKENLADQAAGLERKEDVEEVGDILFELTRRETRAFSRQFSTTLIARWKDAGSLNKNPARSASFVVLKAFDVPSVLLELGYLSSEKDLARLTAPHWRERAAEKTAEAVAGFFAARSREARVPAHSAPNPQRPQ